MVGGGREAVAFGVLVSSVKLNKTVSSRFPGDNFEVGISSESAAVASASTGATGNSATTGNNSVVTPIEGMPFHFQEKALAGDLRNYTASWKCTRFDQVANDLPQGGQVGTSADIHVGVGDDIECTITNTALKPGITMTKRAGAPVDANKDGIIDAGDTIPYSFEVKNTGQTILTGITVNDPKAGSVSCPDGEVQPGQTVTCTATYTITADDQDAGEAHNVATASGTPPGTTSPVTSPKSETRTPVEKPAPSLSLTKSADKQELVVGETVKYSFVVTNTGNVTLNDVKVDETAFSGSGDKPGINCPDEAKSLAPGDQVTCTADYVVTQADVDAGKIENTATATGTPPSGDPVTSDPSSVKIPEDPKPGISLVKSADQKELVAGETITYSFKATNIGNVTLTDVKVNEGDFSGSGKLSAITCPEEAKSLLPGQSVTCTATYRVTQDDVNRGSIENTATATGTPPGGDPVSSDPSKVTVPGDQKPGISLVKSADQKELVAGETITYSFKATNTGNVTLTDVKINEGDFSGSGKLSAITCPEEAKSLLPGQSVTCTATYRVTQDDVNRGSVKNTATATGTPPNGGDPVTSAPADATVPQDPKPGISLVKSADKTKLVVGDTVKYSFVVTNTGNVTLTDVTVNEGAFSGSGKMSAITCPEEAKSLAPGAQVTCSATYRVTQEDVDAGTLVNTATATGTPPNGGEPVVSDPSAVKIPEDPKPGIALVKSADKTELVAGETIAYSFKVTNTGNVTLTDVMVNEGAFSGSGKLSGVTCPDAAKALLPGQSVTCTATYQVTQADVDRGSVENTATATGTPPNGGEPVNSPPSKVTVPQDPKPGISLVKSADKTELVAGETVKYSFAVTNTGNVTLADVKINEHDFSGSGTLSAVTCPAGAKALAPGAQVTCSATYRVTQEDVDAGKVTNTATATGTPPNGGEPVTSDPSKVALPQDPKPGISLVKSADKTKVKAGEEIIYTFLVTNTGNVTLKGVAVNEGAFSGSGKLSALSCPEGASVLLPGQRVSCTASYTATEADAAAGAVHNTATATGTPPGGAPVTTDPSSVTVKIIPVLAPPAPPAPPALANTGAAIGGGLAGAAGLSILGGVLYLVSRRRKADA